MWQTLIPFFTSFIDKVIPDQTKAAEAKMKMLELAQNGELAVLAAEKEMALGQIKVNEVEASGTPMQRNWRPAAGWVCVFGLAYQFLLMPLLPWIMAVFGVATPPMPPIDNQSLMGLLMGLLGLGGFRTFERIKGKV